MSRERRSNSELLTGEWACLGLLFERPTHGFSIARELAPSGNIGRIWSLSRPLVYRAIDQLIERDLIEERGEEPGRAGGNKTIYAPNRAGRTAFRTWVTTPITHPRDVRSELLLKLVLARRCSLSVDGLILEQRRLFDEIRTGLRDQIRSSCDDLVLQWRLRSTEAAIRFLHDLDTAS